jgi:hypothetical protein
MTAEELEVVAADDVERLRQEGLEKIAEDVRQLVVRYKAARIRINNLEKALEALDNGR